MQRKKGFTLIELLVVVAIIALLISILLPSLSRARELSKRLVCAANVKGLGTAFKIYSNDNEEQWPTPAFSEQDAIINWFNQGTGNTLYNPDVPILNANPSPGRLIESDNSANRLSTTRSFWMLVRTGDVTPKGFICPSSGDTTDPVQNVDLYFDFDKLTNVSYGYQVPFGPFDSRASENIDPRLAVAADKGPHDEQPDTTKLAANFADFDPFQPNFNMTPNDWKSYNSGNHGGQGTGEGQNVLFGDGHASFERTPVVGIDQDNIYTIIDDSASPTGRASGSVNFGTLNYPGQNSLGNLGDSTTDSLIYP
jgi:prepilin-type N-terminal cleavage/methylation domain-containing protein/prepilin-type processing-associated H-X9-DG protein